jgi:PII-like signaling protein
MHGFRLLSLRQDLPLAIVIVDDEEQVRRFLPTLRELVDEGLVIVERVEIMQGADRRPAPTHA